jgi:L-aminopeptidase/D-esterase-like protein
MITDVPGFLVGHCTLEDAGTGCTVILCPPSTVAGGLVCGGWPGSRDMAILEPTNASPGIDAIAFSGRSVFGLGVADGVIRWIQENRSPEDQATAIVPQVPAAVINDLTAGDRTQYPTADHGYIAAAHAGTQFKRGSVGAGIGASVGWLRREQPRVKGGIGTATISFGDEGIVSALAVVNACGNVLDERGQIIAGPRDADGEYIDPVKAMQADPLTRRTETEGTRQTHTTLVAIATNAKLTKTQCSIITRMASAGMASAIRPVFTPFDGDIIITASAGEVEVSEFALGVLASQVVAESIRDAVR